LRSKPLAGKNLLLLLITVIEPLPGLLELALIARPSVVALGHDAIRLLKLTRHSWRSRNLAGVVADLEIKLTATSCPWDLKRFGGVAVWQCVHWALGVADGGGGGTVSRQCTSADRFCISGGFALSFLPHLWYWR
jgi:membrane-associated PAP2 superfamily phosphatase